MLKVSAGHYRDSFAKAVYEVKRYSVPLGTRMESGWKFMIPKFGICKTAFPTKNVAASQARVAILNYLDANSGTRHATKT
jgi:hypothetical protein